MTNGREEDKRAYDLRYKAATARRRNKPRPASRQVVTGDLGSFLYYSWVVNATALVDDVQGVMTPLLVTPIYMAEVCRYIYTPR